MAHYLSPRSMACAIRDDMYDCTTRFGDERATERARAYGDVGDMLYTRGCPDVGVIQEMFDFAIIDPAILALDAIVRGDTRQLILHISAIDVVDYDYSVLLLC